MTILEILSQRGIMRAAEIAEAVVLPIEAVYEYLAVLEALGLVRVVGIPGDAHQARAWEAM